MLLGWFSTLIAMRPWETMMGEHPDDFILTIFIVISALFAFAVVALLIHRSGEIYNSRQRFYARMQLHSNR
jgi:hypothetical protein